MRPYILSTLTNDYEDYVDKISQSGLLIFKLQNLSEIELFNLSKCFGRPQVYFPTNNSHPEIKEIGYISNKTDLGYSNAGFYWHTDGTYYKDPPRYTFLYCIEAPSIGGDTLFCDSHILLNHFSADVIHQFKQMDALYPMKVLVTLRNRREGIEDQDLESEDVYHKIIDYHPITNLPFLKVNQKYMQSIKGITASDSDLLINYIFDTVENNKENYRHKWEKGDLLIWDNQRALHKATPVLDQSIKHMMRITVGVKNGI